MKTKKIFLSVFLFFLAVVTIYFSICLILFFFEPAEYNEANLDNASSYSFDRYKIFDKSLNSNFYIKQISSDDIVSTDDKLIKYTKDTIIVIADKNTDYSAVASLAAENGGSICGYIKCVSYYQIEFKDYSYDDLINICSVLLKNKCILNAMPDYFEETPGTEYSTSEFSENTGDSYYAYDAVNAYNAWKKFNTKNTVKIGIIDTPVDYSNSDITVANSTDYSINDLYSESLNEIKDHGTHVAGIICAKHDNDSVSGMCPSAELYSYNGINNTLSYWIASISRMIALENVKVINISMGYNSFVNISASLGDSSAIDFIKKENDLFSNVLERLISEGYEFVICVAAGNNNNTTICKTFNSFFKYNQKKYLSEFDVFNIFKTECINIDAAYNFFLTCIDNQTVSDRIITVGAYNAQSNEYLYYSDVGKKVDIAAPGAYIYSTVTNDTFDYMSGTSMAAPFVSGTAAMLFAEDSTLSGDEVKKIIITSASDNIETGAFIYPKLDSEAALDNLLNKKTGS